MQGSGDNDEQSTNQTPRIVATTKKGPLRRASNSKKGKYYQENDDCLHTEKCCHHI